MRIDIERGQMVIIPEGVGDELYLEEVFGLKKKGDKIEFTRKYVSSEAGHWGYLEARSTK